MEKKKIFSQSYLNNLHINTASKNETGKIYKYYANN